MLGCVIVCDSSTKPISSRRCAAEDSCAFTACAQVMLDCIAEDTADRPYAEIQLISQWKIGTISLQLLHLVFEMLIPHICCWVADYNFGAARCGKSGPNTCLG